MKTVTHKRRRPGDDHTHKFDGKPGPDPDKRYGPNGRKLTFAEEKVDFDLAESRLDEMEQNYRDEIREIYAEERNRFMSALMTAAADGNYKKIRDMRFGALGAVRERIKPLMLEGYELGKQAAAGEMDVPPPPTPNRQRSLMNLHADAAARHQVQNIENMAKVKLADGLARKVAPSQAVSGVDEFLQKNIDSAIRNTSGIVGAGYMNNGRQAVYEENSDQIYALQRSEVLDARTCNYCLSVDGRIVEKNDDFAKNAIFHTGCRGIWVEILKDEQELPDIDGVPDSLRDRFGYGVNELVQPQNAQTKDGSLAKRFLQSRNKG